MEVLTSQILTDTIVYFLVQLAMSSSRISAYTVCTHILLHHGKRFTYHSYKSSQGKHKKFWPKVVSETRILAKYNSKEPMIYTDFPHTLYFFQTPTSIQIIFTTARAVYRFQLKRDWQFIDNAVLNTVVISNHADTLSIRICMHMFKKCLKIFLVVIDRAQMVLWILVSKKFTTPPLLSTCSWQLREGGSHYPIILWSRDYTTMADVGKISQKTLLGTE